MQDYIDALREDTRLLSEVPPVQGLLRSSRNRGVDLQGRSSVAQWEQRLQKIFAAMLRTQPDYLMARFIGADGRERVRVDRTAEGIVAAGKDALQDKADRPYVIDTLELPADRLLLADIDLNR